MVTSKSSFVLVLLSLLSSSSSSIHLVHAAPSSSSSSTFFTPSITYGASSVFVEASALYVQGGVLVTRDSVTQTFALALNSSWSIHYPTFTKLPDGISTFYSPGTLLNDDTTWLVIRNSTQAASYNIQTSITTPSASIPPFNNMIGLRAVTDATTGDVIIPNGYLSTNLSSTYTMRYTPSTSTTTPLLQSPDLNNLTFYAIAWSNTARAAFMLGGYYPSAQSSTAGFYRLDSGATAWTKLETAGPPTARESACMVPASNGTKLVVFGGLSTSGAFLGDIYILDVATSTWNKGTDGGETRARTGHVCAVSGDKFVAWGGEGALSVSDPSKVETVSVYSMTTNTWLDQYLVPGSAVPPPPPPTDSTSVPQPPNPNILIVAGGCAAGLVAITAVLIWIYRRREARLRELSSLMYAQPSAPQDVDDGSQLEDVPLSTIVAEKVKKEEAKSSSNNPQWGAMDLIGYQESSQMRSPQSYQNTEFQSPHPYQDEELQRQAYKWPRPPGGQVTPEAEEMQLLQMQIEREQLLSQHPCGEGRMQSSAQVHDRDTTNSMRSPQLYRPKVDRRYLLDS